MKSKDFSFKFTKDISKFVVFGRNVREIRSKLYKICRTCLGFLRVKTDLEVSKAQKF